MDGDPRLLARRRSDLRLAVLVEYGVAVVVDDDARHVGISALVSVDTEIHVPVAVAFAPQRPVDDEARTEVVAGVVVRSLGQLERLVETELPDVLPEHGSRRILDTKSVRAELEVPVLVT